jgi:hypothetical protein
MGTLELYGARFSHALSLAAAEPGNVDYPVAVVLIAEDGIIVPMGHAWSWRQVQERVAWACRRFDDPLTDPAPPCPQTAPARTPTA